MAQWKNGSEDDGAIQASDDALRQAADGVVTAALTELGRAFAEEGLKHQLRATLLLDQARAMRVDVRRGSWTRLAAQDRRQLRYALLVLETLIHNRAPIPLV